MHTILYCSYNNHPWVLARATHYKHFTQTYVARQSYEVQRGYGFCILLVHEIITYRITRKVNVFFLPNTVSSCFNNAVHIVK